MPADTDIPVTAPLVNPFPPKTVAGARAMYAHDCSLDPKFSDKSWDELIPQTQNAYCLSFVAGLKALLSVSDDGEMVEVTSANGYSHVATLESALTAAIAYLAGGVE